MNRDKNAFLESLVYEMHDLLVNYANIKLNDRNSAYDAVQETYLAAQKNIEKLMNSENPRGWLIETLKYKIMHEVRAKARFLRIIQKMEQATSIGKTHEDIHEYEIGEMLMKNECEILCTIYLEGYSIKETAAELGITYEACKKRVQTAKRKLAKD